MKKKLLLATGITAGLYCVASAVSFIAVYTIIERNDPYMDRPYEDL